MIRMIKLMTTYGNAKMVDQENDYDVNIIIRLFDFYILSERSTKKYQHFLRQSCTEKVIAVQKTSRLTLSTIINVRYMYYKQFMYFLRQILFIFFTLS